MINRRSGRGRRDVLAVPSDKVARWVVVGDDDDLVGLGLGLRDAHLLAPLPHHLLKRKLDGKFHSTYKMFDFLKIISRALCQ